MVVPNALNELKGTEGYWGLPPGFEAREFHICESCIAFEGDAELTAALKLMGAAHRAVTGASRVKGKVNRVSGTPCPKIHVDSFRLRIMSTLRGPSVVLHPDEDNMETEIRTNEGDVVFMRGAFDGEVGGILHKSPPREDWMDDRVIVQVDDW